MNKLRVLMISEYPYSEGEQGRGGILQSTFHLIEGFEALGDTSLELHLISQTSVSDRYESRRQGDVVLHFVPRKEGEFDKFVINPLAMSLKVLRLIWKIRPHVVHGQGSPLAILLSQSLASKNVQTVHGIYRNEQAMLPLHRLGIGRKIRIYMTEWVERYYLRNIRNVIALTDEIQELVMGATGGRARVFRSYVAIDPVFFSRALQGRKIGQVQTILFVAAITPRKGLEYLLEAFEKISGSYPDVRLRIVGMWDWAPDYVTDLQARYKSLIAAERLAFTGGVDRNQLLEEYERADLFVLPSLSESAPAVVSQAMCMKVPLIATRVGGIPEMVSDGVTGLLVEPASVEELEEALCRLLNDATLRSRLSEAAYEEAMRRYHPRSVAAVTLGAYLEIAAT